MRISLNAILNASKEKLEQLTVMALFESAFSLWAAEHKEHTYYLPLRYIHEHAQTFVNGIGLSTPGFHCGEDGESPAVKMFLDETNETENGFRTLGWSIVAYEFPTEALRSRCENYAKLTGVSLDQVRSAMESFIAETKKHTAATS